MCLKTSINTVSFLPDFYTVFSVLLTAQWRLQHTGSSGLAGVFNYDLYRKTQFACFAYLCHHPLSHFTKLLNRVLFFGPCHCSYIFVPCLAFSVHVADYLNKIISFRVGILSTSLD